MQVLIVCGVEGMMTKLLEKEHIKIKCPHCAKKISSAWICKMDSVIGIRYAFLCSSCQKLLGISINKNPIFISGKENNITGGFS